MLDKFERLWKEWYALKQGVGKQIIKKKKTQDFFNFFKKFSTQLREGTSRTLKGALTRYLDIKKFHGKCPIE